MVDDADLRTGLISALVEYLRWDDAGPPVRLLLLARAAGTWWDRLVRQQELAGAYTVLDLDRHPVPPADRAEHFRRASTAFAAYRGPGAPPADVPPPAELDDPAYAGPAADPHRRAVAHGGHIRHPTAAGPGLRSAPRRKTAPQAAGPAGPAGAAAGAV